MCGLVAGADCRITDYFRGRQSLQLSRFLGLILNMRDPVLQTTLRSLGAPRGGRRICYLLSAIYYRDHCLYLLSAICDGWVQARFAKSRFPRLGSRGSVRKNLGSLVSVPPRLSLRLVLASLLRIEPCEPSLGEPSPCEPSLLRTGPCEPSLCEPGLSRLSGPGRARQSTAEHTRGHRSQITAPGVTEIDVNIHGGTGS